MLVRNLTQGSLNLKGISGKKITLPALKIVNIDELEFPAERVKRYFGRYIQILTEKVEEIKDEVPTESKENLEFKESNSDVPVVGQATTKEENGENISTENNNTDTNIENIIDDSDDVDKLVDSVLEEIEGEDAGKEENIAEKTEEKPVKTAKKTGKKASKK